MPEIRKNSLGSNRWEDFGLLRVCLQNRQDPGRPQVRSLTSQECHGSRRGFLDPKALLTGSVSIVAVTCVSFSVLLPHHLSGTPPWRGLMRLMPGFPNIGQYLSASKDKFYFLDFCVCGLRCSNYCILLYQT